MGRMHISETPAHIGAEVELAGWVSVRRDHGKLIFIDLRDATGVLQLVCTPKNEAVYKNAEKLRPEWVIGVSGVVQERPKGMGNPDIPTGAIELPVDELEIISEAETPPFPLDTDGRDIDEELRLKYRYLDLRRARLQKNIRARHEVIQFIRGNLSRNSFVEIETPMLTKGTPEGAREFTVPSRLHRGKFYVLPQSPQQFKQLLMVAGFERYFQIARCFRDEDTRGDRQPEFTQLDLEMSFVEREDIMALNEALLIEIVKNLYPEKRIQDIPFPRLSHADAMAKYGTDRPDLRKDKNDPNLLAFCWVVDFPFFEKSEAGGWTFTHNPFSAPHGKESWGLYDRLLTNQGLSDKEISSITAAQYDIVLNGFEVGGGSMRAHNQLTLINTFQIMGYEKKEILERFGHMLDAFRYGVPPHGGIAWGLDRLIAILQSEPNIREVIAFPKTGDARDPMMDSPSPASEKQLKELHIRITE